MLLCCDATRGEPGGRSDDTQDFTDYSGACTGSPDSFKEKLPFPLYTPQRMGGIHSPMQALFSTWVRVFTDVFFKDVGSFCSLPLPRSWAAWPACTWTWVGITLVALSKLRVVCSA